MRYWSKIAIFYTPALHSTPTSWGLRRNIAITFTVGKLNDLQSHKLMLAEPVNMAQNWPLRKLLAMRDAVHCCGASWK